MPLRLRRQRTAAPLSEEIFSENNL